MTDMYVVGSVPTVLASFKVNEVPTDPTAITLMVRHPDGSLTQVDSPIALTPVLPVIRDDVGKYHADLETDEIGRWAYRWQGSGTAEGAQEGSFFVVSSVVDAEGGLDFLNHPGDMDAIRLLLGETDLILTDIRIQAEPFAPHAEAIVKSLVDDWETLLIPADPDSLQRLEQCRLASMYATAALIAETMAQGGFPGWIRPEGGRTQAEWLRLAQTLWSYFGTLSNAAQGPGMEPIMGGLPLMVLAGPSRAMLAQRPYWPWWWGTVDPMSG